MSTAAIAPAFGFHRPPRSAPRLRLTQRGRAVLTFLAATPLVIGALLFVLAGGTATASLEGSGTTFEYVTIEPGQTLWEVAETIAPAADPRDVISDLMSLNQLNSADVWAGQELAIPGKYTR